MNPVARTIVKVTYKDGSGIFRCAVPLPHGRSRAPVDLSRNDAQWCNYVWMTSRNLAHHHHARQARP